MGICFYFFLLLVVVDVQFWRSRKSLEGLSVRSVFFNVFQSLIVLLYILDNETNYVIIISVFIGKGEGQQTRGEYVKQNISTSPARVSITAETNLFKGST